MLKEKNNKTEQGRSMVEMLGVLAVIGVLSVAGIAGYSNAMKKHRANEILNEASKRAVLVATQAMTGKTGEISLSEFGNNSVSGVTFSKAEIKENHIVLTLSGTGLADICDQLKNATGNNTVMKVTQNDCSELTFNADMSTGETVTSSGSTGEACDTDNPCVDGCQECVNGHCQDKCTDGKTCAPAWGGERDEDNLPIYTGFTCINKPSGCSACTSNQYCKVRSSDENCTNPDTGSCLNKESNSDFNARKVRITFSDTTTLDVYVGTDYVSWWTAKNWCEAHGKQMVTLADLKCSLSTVDCNDWSALESLDTYGLWTKDGSDWNYCRATAVSPRDHEVLTNERFVNESRALCKD